MDALKLMQQTVPTGKLKWTSDEVDPMKPFHFVRHKWAGPLGFPFRVACVRCGTPSACTVGG